PEPRFINVRRTISAVGWDLSQAARDKGVTITNNIPDDLGFYTDPNLFTEVAQNIIANAIKFTRKGGVITTYAPDDCGACLAVEDTGIGIPASILPNLFKHEVKTTTTGTGGEKGTGLGLPFCAEIMRILGGSISVESEQGKGSVFYIRLPHVKPMILLVEDEVEDRKLIKGVLRDINVEIVEVENGRQALEKLETVKPHLVILDIMLPLMSGYELLKAIRRNPATKNIPVIAVSVSGKAETSEKAIQLGANDFVSKPISIHDLIPRIKRFISLGS
ncbi:MAG: response regulator, partial [Nitrospinota bacterium]|nr:response regulator [Nitrospinota bacterium]